VGDWLRFDFSKQHQNFESAQYDAGSIARNRRADLNLRELTGRGHVFANKNTNTKQTDKAHKRKRKHTHEDEDKHKHKHKRTNTTQQTQRHSYRQGRETHDKPTASSVQSQHAK
jgi:hypothetical protein